MKKTAFLPRTNELHWVVYVVETTGMDGILRRNWIATTPTIIGIDYSQQRLEQKIIDKKVVRQNEFEDVLKSIKPIERGGVSSSSYKGLMEEISIAECLDDFENWRNKQGIPESHVVVCENYENYVAECRKLHNHIIQGKKFGQFPFNTSAGYRLWS